MVLEVVLIASGGGHTAYAVSVGERLYEKDRDLGLTFIVPHNDRWSINRILDRIPSAKIIEITKPLNPLEPYVKLIERLPITIVDVLKKLPRETIVLCTGSNHNIFPVLIGKYWFKNHVFCIEDIFRIEKRSRTVDLLHRIGRVNVFLQWRIQKKLYRDGIYSGVLFEKPKYHVRDEGYILVTTGTIGNRELFKLLHRSGVENLIIQTGRIEPSILRNDKLNWKAFRFDPDIDRLIAGASLIIASPGITAINAIQAYHKPLIMVYNPDIVLGASYKEIEYIANQFNIPFIDPRRISGEEFRRIVDESYDLKPRIQPDGSSFIAEFIYRFVKNF